MKVNLYSFLLASLLFLIQCDLDDDNLQLESDVGTFVVWLTDAPLNFENIKEVNFTLEDVAIRDAETGDQITLQDDRVNINLMNFRNGDMQIIAGNSQIPPGMYDQVQFQIIDLVIELNDDTDVNVQVPARAQSGYTIDLEPNAEVIGARNTELLLDLDLYQSITQQGEGDNFFNSFSFDPVIRWAILGNTGRIEGTMLNESSELIENVLLKLSLDGNLVGTTFSEPNGEFGFVGIEPATYTLTVEKENFANDTLSVIVESQRTQELNITLEAINGN